MAEGQAQLLAHAVQGDAKALGALLEQCSAKLIRELRKEHRWLSTEDADDVMQVTFLEAFLNIRHFNPAAPGSFTGWLHRIAENNVRDLVRTRQRAKRPPPDKRVERADGDSAVALLDLLADSTATPSRRVAAREAQAMLAAAIEKLPESYQQVVRLYDLEGKSVEETAAVLGRSCGSVFMLRARAHEHLARLLGSDSRFFSSNA